jgi:type IV secretory pathway TrbD component
MDERSQRGAALDRPRAIPIHRALTRPVLLAGADRELAIANGVIVAALLFGIGLSWYTASVSAALLLIGHWALVLLAKHDPDLRRVYVRHVALAAFYSAAPRELRRAPLVHPSVTVSE